jgi:uncharacterized delta-60 repeat protein
VYADQEGYLDASFDFDGKLLLENRGLGQLSGAAIAPVQQADGKWVVAAYSDAGFLLARFNTDGTLDTTFGESGITRVLEVNVDQQAVRALLQQRDGQLLIIGSADKIAGTAGTVFFVKRFTANGLVDDGFGEDGQVTTSLALSASAWTAIEQKDGKLLVGGRACVEAEPPSPTGQFICHNSAFALVRYLANGELDTDFGWKGIVIQPVSSMKENVLGLLEQADGKLVALGSSGDDVAWARFNSNGSLDMTFADGRGKAVLLDSVSGTTPMFIAQDADGKLLLAGSLLQPGLTAFLLQRYKTSGKLDSSFGVDGSTVLASGTNSQLTAFSGLQSGDWIAVGEVCFRRKDNKANGMIICADSDIVMARFNGKGELDTDFAQEGILVTSIAPARDIPLAVIEQNDSRLSLMARSCQSIHCSYYDFSMVRYTMHLDSHSEKEVKPPKRRWFSRFWPK